MTNPQPPTTPDHSGGAPLPPLPAAGLAAAMPDWLRSPSSAPSSDDLHPPEDTALTVETETLDPATFLTADDLPVWLRQLAGEPDAAAGPPSLPDVGTAAGASVLVHGVPDPAAADPGTVQAAQVSATGLSMVPSTSLAPNTAPTDSGLASGEPVRAAVTGVATPPAAGDGLRVAAVATATAAASAAAETSATLAPIAPNPPPDLRARTFPDREVTPPDRATPAAAPSSGRWIWLSILALGLVILAYLLATVQLR